MAIARPSSLIGAISGSLDSVTFSNRKTGLVIGHRGQKAAGASSQALAARALQADAARRWGRDLTEAQREQWRKASQTFTRPNRIGQQRNLSGFQLFLWENSFIDHIELPPTSGTTPMPTDVTLSMTDPTPYNFSFTNPFSPTNLTVKILIATTSSNQQPRSFYRWRFIFSDKYNTGTFQFAHLWPTDTYARPVEGEWVGFRIAAKLSGMWPSQPAQLMTQII